MSQKHNKGKKILIITYYWPPSGGGGVQRWVKFVKYLDRLGWDCTVYIPSNPEYPATDASMAKDVPKGITVLKNKIWEPFNLYKKVTKKKKGEKIAAGFLTEEKKKNKLIQNLSVWVRGNFFIPDARRFWIKPSIKYLKKYLKDNPVDVIVSTGPPHTINMIGLGVKQKTNIPWVADFRDPWTNIDFYKDLKLTKLADNKHKRLEKKVLSTADAVITIGKTLGEELQQLGAEKVDIITNGYDAEDIENRIIEKDVKFSISHIGTLNKSRNPDALWTALKSLIAENEAFEKQLEIKLVGPVDIEVQKSIKENGLEKYLHLIPYLPHDQAIIEQKKSHLLLLLVNDTPNAKGILTGKMFEYMSTKNPILGIGPMDGDAAEILMETKAGEMCGYKSVDEMKKYILSIFEGGIQESNTAVEKYSRKVLTDRLVEVLERVISEKAN